MRNKLFLLLLIAIILTNCSDDDKLKNNVKGPFDESVFLQDYSIKYYPDQQGVQLKKVTSDRNGYIQILGADGLYHPGSGEFLVPGKIVKDLHYRPLAEKNVSALTHYEGQFVYADDSALFSNAWAGSFYVLHSLPAVKIIEGGRDFTFMISDGNELRLLNRSGLLWNASVGDSPVRDICFNGERDEFLILCGNSVIRFSVPDNKVETLLKYEGISCIELSGNKLIAGTGNGYLEIDPVSGKINKGPDSLMPCTDLTVVRNINGNLWFGSSRGAMRLRDDGKYDYYASRRWLPSDSVTDIAVGPGNSVLVLTDKGLAKICFQEMTLLSKAMYYEGQVRERHIRNGFNATVSGMVNGDLLTGSLEDSDNDGLWTSMYLAAEAFRYNVTKDSEALCNVRESLDAIERLFTINGIPGFPSRSFERRGYKYDDPAWRRASDPEWDWKSTTSSDEAIGHVFAYGVIAELVDNEEVRGKAIALIDTLMSHIVKNGFYLVDWDGKPTRWGRWNPEYVNAFPEMIGDRKLNSSNIIGMLQTAYHFTGKEKYRDAAITLMKDHGYLENLMRPMSEIGFAPGTSDDLSKLLSDGWNHSDDEMYF